MHIGWQNEMPLVQYEDDYETGQGAKMSEQQRLLLFKLNRCFGIQEQ